MFNEEIIPNLYSKAHWQVTQALTQPKPAKELSFPDTLTNEELRWVTKAHSACRN